MVGNLIRRRFFETEAPPPADEINIDGFMGMNDIPHLPAMHLPPGEVWKAKMAYFTDQADAGTGFAPGWGEGQVAWDITPSEAPDGTTALENLLGVFPAGYQYVDPDPAGAIQFLEYGTRWSIAGAMTPYLYVEADYAADDEPAESIREVGLYLNVDPATGHEADSYLTVGNIDDLGQLVALDRILIASRSPETSGKVRFILRVGHG